VRWLTEPLAYEFFVRALAAGVLVGALTGAVGVFVVVRRMSYIGHGLSHSLLGGIAVALALGGNVYAGAAAAALASALLIEVVARGRGLAADAAIGIVTTGMFALGVAVLGLLDGPRANAESLLFGSILGIGAADLVLAALAAAAVALALFAGWKRLVFTAFDPLVADVQGVRARLVGLLLDVLVAVAVVVGVRLLGVLLVAAAVVVPAAAARQLSHRTGVVLGLAALAGATAAVAGLYASWHLEVPSGPAIVLIAVFLFLSAATAGSIVARGRPPRVDSR
jgi:ABC-type Mn2+/Zn2+ transport system permease subunit